MKIKKNEINLYDTLMSGQCFRAHLEENGSFTIILKDRVINVLEQEDYLIVESNKLENLEKVIIDYFDLLRDYNFINNFLIKDDEYMKTIILSSKGFKILKQDPFEMFISYIISQNNNVKRIEKSVEKISEKFGKKCIFNKKEYFLFPTLEEIKNITLEDLRNCGVGFRDKYIKSNIEFLVAHPNFLFELDKLDSEEAMKRLVILFGIGPKVASCILLFAYHKLDVFPIDTWVKHNIEDNYKQIDNSIKSITKFAKKKYKEYSAVAIQYMFNYARNKKEK